MKAQRLVKHTLMDIKYLTKATLKFQTLLLYISIVNKDEYFLAF